MKFGKYLAKRQLELPEYSSYFINYKGLKKLIKSLGTDDSQSSSSRLSNIESALQAHKVTFFFRLERELEKVNAFYLQKEAELKLRLAALLEKKKTAKSKIGAVVKTSATFIALYEGFARFHRDLDKLEQFVELNATGFSKVLKKWDKRSKSQTKELYLSTAVEVQPVFHREEIAELSDLATTSLLELEAWAEGEDVSFDHRIADVSQIERTNEELDMEFLRNVSRESEAAIGEWISKLQQAPDASERITRVFLQSISGDASDSTLRSLYQTGAVDLSARDDVNDRTILHEAAISNRTVILDLLLSQPDRATVDASAADIYGRTPLHYACIHGREQMIRPLLTAGAPIDALDQDNFTALLFAIAQDHSRCVAELLECGARVDPASEQDYIPLSVACQRGLYSITEMLLQHNASIFADAEGLYPQHLIAQAGHCKLIPLLKAYGADVNTVDKLNGWIALFYAAGEGHLTTVKALIDAGSDLSFVDKKNLSPVYYAAWEGHLDCMELLINAQTSQGISLNRESILPQTAKLSNTITQHDFPSDSAPLEMDLDMSDVDAIPDLSLPPPILPLRRYGHNFLDKKTFIEIVFEAPIISPSALSPSSSTSIHRASTAEYSSGGQGVGSINSSVVANQPPVRFYSNIPASKLTVSSKLLDVIPRSLLLPLADDGRTLSFQIENLDEFSIDFEVFPTFGSRIIAKTTALSHIFKAASGVGTCTLPLFDLRLHVIGDISFKFIVIKPYSGTPLEITNYDVYWKSTSQIDQPSAPSSLASVIGTNTSTAGSGLLSNSYSSALSLSSGGAVPTSSGFHHIPHSQVHSFVTASSLSGCYAQVFVQLTKDRIPVVYPFWTVEVAQFKVPICNLTYEQFEALGMRDPETARKREQIRFVHKASEACDLLEGSYLSLEETLARLPIDVSLDLAILYPTPVEKEYLNVSSAMLNLNDHVNAILNVVFDHARKARRETAPKAAAAAAANPSSTILRNRSLIFSSYHPNVCTVLNWKQPNYPVFFCVDISATEDSVKFVSAHDLPVKEPEDRRCGSMREATAFASSNNLMGLICDSRLLNMVPALIESIRVSGLVLVAQNNSFSKYNGGPGIDGIRDDKILEFSETIDM
ncbi:ankyrin repeat protein nuc-2 [Myxozyma melibiosi]|uniref:Ankyrin repeat protein nuc-2 n=1 Tax=Myxozyma melibiosi TaxID=54550 RepID=A0ABR1F581_9ASCO